MVKKTYIKNDGKKELLELEVIRHESKKLYFPITSARCRSGICCEIGRASCRERV